MEIIRGRTAAIRFTVPPDLASATYKIYRNDEQLGPAGIATIVYGFATVVPPWSAVAVDSTIKIVLRFAYEGEVYEEEQFVDVVTPYIDIGAVKALIGTANDVEALEAEAAARFIINAHCGQRFGRYDETKKVPGSNTFGLALPERIIKIKSFNGTSNPDYVQITGEGFYLEYYNWGMPTVKSDAYGLHQHVGGVIHNPNNVSVSRFHTKNIYTISGIWGYEQIPPEVKEATRLLIAMYADPDSEYRDRYLTSMTAADWRIQFHAGAFVETGHVRADQLLAPYVLRRGWAVL